MTKGQVKRIEKAADGQQPELPRMILVCDKRETAGEELYRVQLPVEKDGRFYKRADLEQLEKQYELVVINVVEVDGGRDNAPV